MVTPSQTSSACSSYLDERTSFPFLGLQDSYPILKMSKDHMSLRTAIKFSVTDLSLHAGLPLLGGAPAAESHTELLFYFLLLLLLLFFTRKARTDASKRGKGVQRGKYLEVGLHSSLGMGMQGSQSWDKGGADVRASNLQVQKGRTEVTFLPSF